jgi:hypothetical protein
VRCTKYVETKLSVIIPPGQEFIFVVRLPPSLSVLPLSYRRY